jgi:hypothetical protein
LLTRASQISSVDGTHFEVRFAKAAAQFAFDGLGDPASLA